MKTTYLTAVCLIAPLMLVIGCSDQSSQSTGKALPAPARSTDTARTLPPPDETEDSVFAALDTDSNRVLDEREWQSDEARNMSNLKNLSFAQIDRNSSGGIEPDEFGSARTGGDASANAGTASAVRESDPDTTDAAGP